MKDSNINNILLGPELFVAGYDVSKRPGTTESTKKFYSFADILRCFSVLESCCLYDVLWINSWKESESSELPKGFEYKEAAREELAKRSDFWHLLKEENVFHFSYMSDWGQSVGKMNDEKWRTECCPLLVKHLADPDQFETYWNLAYSEIVGFSYVPDFTEIGKIQNVKNIKLAKKVNNALHSAYAELSKTLKNEFESLRNFGRPIEIFIPPIPALILDKVSDPKEIPDATMELRVKLEPVRKAFRDYEMTVRDVTLPPKESFGALRRLEEITRDLTQRYPTNNILSITEWRDFFDIDPENLLKGDIDVTKIMKLLIGWPIERLVSYWKNRHIMYLFKLKKKFLNIKESGRLIQKVYGVEIKEKEVESLRKYQKLADVQINQIATS